MRITRDDRPTPWFNRRDQYRMLAMVGLLCLVMVAIKLAARPSSWYWLLPPGETQAATHEDRSSVTFKELDFRVKTDPPRESLPPDVFRAVAVDDSGTNESDHGESVEAREPVSETPSGRSRPASAASATELLAGIEDNTIGVRRAEVEAYHQMLDTIRRLPDDQRAAHALDDVAFTVIMLQSDNYRGQIVGITGQLMRLGGYPVMENEQGIDRLYEGWIFTGDSGNNPWRFVCSELPYGATLQNLNLPLRVRVEGYFFKRMGYASEGGQHVAPTLLAKTFEVLPVPVNRAPQMQAQMRNWMLGLIALVIIGLGGLIWWFIAADRRYTGSRLHELATSRLDASRDDLESLKDLDTHDPSQLFTDAADEPS